jgi:hypothetical protein
MSGFGISASGNCDGGKNTVEGCRSIVDVRRTNRSLIRANECNFRRIRAAQRELIGNALIYVKGSNSEFAIVLRTHRKGPQ